jgi:hypothetical protein
MYLWGIGVADAGGGTPCQEKETGDPPYIYFCREMVSISPRLIGREGEGLVHYCWRRGAVIEEVFSPHQLMLIEKGEATCIYFR